jgi:hypothetical protein
MKDDIFQKKSRFYYSTATERNILMYVVVLMLCKNKNIIAKLKNQNGDENIFLFFK